MPRKTTRQLAREEMDQAIETHGPQAVVDRLVEQLFESCAHYQATGHQKRLDVADILESMLPRITEHMGPECEELARLSITHLRMS